MQSPLPRPKRILIIGGGPSGLVALRNLSERGHFDVVELVERRDDVGGVWYLDRPDNLKEPKWPSPAYPGLIGNVLPEWVSFSGYPFPPPLSPIQPFPSLSETHVYLRAFAEPFLRQGQIRLNTEVIRVDEIPSFDGGGWKVTFRDWSQKGKGDEAEERWDAVVVATAWYDNVTWPEAEGLEEAKAKGLVKHAKWWKGPQGYEGKRVVVVGNGHSSNDIAAQLAPISQTPVHRSIRHPPLDGVPALLDPRIIDVALITRYSVTPTAECNKVHLYLKDGSEICDVDMVFVGTGYTCGVPFLRVLAGPGERNLATLTSATIQPPRVPSLHRHILYAYNPTLAFVGAVIAITPFIVADVSSTWLALAWSGEIQYPDTLQGRLLDEASRLETVRRLRAETDNPSAYLAFHLLAPAEQDYALGLREEIVLARKELGRVLPQCGDKKRDEINGMFAMKLESLRLASEQDRREGGCSVALEN